MTSTDLLAKIDALDWDQTVSPATTVMAGGKSPAKRPPLLPRRSPSFGLIAGGLALLGIAAAMYFGMVGPGVPARGPAGSALAVAVAPVSGKQASKTTTATEEDHAKVAAVAAAEERRVAMYAQAIKESERNLQDKAERKRKAREAAAQARIAQEERDRRQQEEAKQRTEREAAARAAAKAQEAAVPKGPASPKELCAGESNAFTRGFCESRACGKPEWQRHPFCVKRMEEQLRSFGPN
jgi:type IV secretory pathway VirB10-like protein